MGLLSLIADLGVNINPYLQGLAKAKGEAGKFGNDVNKTLKNSLAGAFGTAAVVGLARKTMEFGGQISDLSDRLDVSTDALQEWNYAATQNGAKADDVTAFFEKIAAAQQDAIGGSDTAIAKFQKLGITMDDLRNSRVEDLGKKIANSVKGGDIQKLSGALKDIGGKSATKLVTAFKAGMDELAAEAHEMGLVMDKEVISKLDRLGDTGDRVMQQLMGPMATLLGWVETAIRNITTTFQLLGAFSARITSWTDIFKIGWKFADFLQSDEASAIVNRAEPKSAPGPSAPGGSGREPWIDQKTFERFAKMEEKLRKQAEKKALQDGLSKDKPGRLGADSLASIGGFIGGAGRMPIVDLAREQLQVQKTIAANTDPKNKPRETFSRV